MSEPEGRGAPVASGGGPMSGAPRVQGSGSSAGQDVVLRAEHVSVEYAGQRPTRAVRDGDEPATMGCVMLGAIRTGRTPPPGQFHLGRLSREHLCRERRALFPTLANVLHGFVHGRVELLVRDTFLN